MIRLWPDFFLTVRSSLNHKKTRGERLPRGVLDQPGVGQPLPDPELPDPDLPEPDLPEPELPEPELPLP